MKILFVIDSMEEGGVARVTAILANELHKKGYEVVIATNLAYRKVFYSVESGIKILSFYQVIDQKKSYLSKLVRHAYFLRKIIKLECPSIIIGEQEVGVLYSYLAKIFLRIPMIGHRHNTFKILGLSKINQLIYNLPNKTVLLHNEDVKYVGSRIKNTIYIYNPHTYPIVENTPSIRKKQIICVGSVDRWYNKGFDIMLKIWGSIESSHKEWNLVIVGGGSDLSFQKLKKFALEYNCIDRVDFKGIVEKIDVLLQESSIFALPSRVEGFPMVLNEAISQRCPSIAFSLNGVLSEIYSEDSVCQIPDGNIDLFKKKLVELMEHEEVRNRYCEKASRETVKYLPKNVVKDWIGIIEEMVNK